MNTENLIRIIKNPRLIKILEKIMVETARILLAATFLFSGFVKAVDPRGFAYKIEDYLSVFNLGAMKFLALPFSILLCIVEFTLGFFLLLGIHRKRSSWAIFILMLFMTPLTLYLAIKDPVTDCGCFGDALIITNWQTFFKNIVLLVCAYITLRHCERITNFYTGKFYWLVTFFGICYITGFSAYNTLYEPIFDFRPYKVGANLAQLTKVKEQGVFETELIYKKDGVEKKFTDKNYPWQDSTWVFVSQSSKLVKEGEKPQISDFEINKILFDKNTGKIIPDTHEDITKDILAYKGYTFMMIAYKLNKMNDSYLGEFEDVMNYCDDHDYKFYCLTSSPNDSITKWVKENAVNFNFCFTDERVLKTITRSNPGLILLKDGIVIHKWADLEVPDEKELGGKLLSEQNFIPHLSDKRTMSWILLLFFVPLAVLKGLDFLFYRNKRGLKEMDKPEVQN